MRLKVCKKGIFLGYFSQFLNVGAGLVLLPFSITYLNTDEASLWLLIMTIASSIGLLDFGFSQTVTRNFSYIIAGAAELKREGIDDKKKKLSIQYPLFFSLLLVTKRIYLVLGIVCIVVLGVFGTLYIHHVSSDTTLDIDIVLTTWGVYTFSISLNVAFLYFIPALLGCGKIIEGYLVNIISRSVMLLLGIVFLILGYGLLGLALSYLTSLVVSRIYSGWAFYRLEYFRYKGGSKQILDKALYGVMWHNAHKLGLVMLGSFLINRSTTLLAGAFLPLDEAGSYTLTMQVFSILVMVSQTYFQAHIPIFSQLQLSSSKSVLKEKYIKCLFVSLLTMFVGVLLFIELGPPILSLIKANITFLSVNLLVLAAIIFLLEMNHSIAATFITTRNEVPFVKASLLSGLSVVILATVLSGPLGLGVLGLLLGQGISQLVYNNWRWPIAAWKIVS